MKTFLTILLAMATVISFTESNALGVQQKNESRRVALLVGNSNYDVGKLQNPANDVNAMKVALEKVGFDVTHRLDRNKLDFENDVDDITADLDENDVCLIFYAGHGQSLEGVNYLIPIGAKVTRPFHLKERCVSLSYLLGALDDSDAGMKILILDSCRDEFPSFSRSNAKLAGIGEIPDSTVVAYSTDDGEVALDGDGKLSPFTKHLTRIIQEDHPQGLTLLDWLNQSGKSMKADKTGQRPQLGKLDLTQERFWIIPSTQPINHDKGLDTGERVTVKKHPNIDWGVRVFERADKKGMQIVRVISGSPAEKGWKPHRDDVDFILEPGDVIQAINGNLTVTAKDFLRELKNSPPRMSVTIFDVAKNKTDIVYFTLSNDPALTQK